MANTVRCQHIPGKAHTINFEFHLTHSHIHFQIVQQLTACFSHFCSRRKRHRCWVAIYRPTTNTSLRDRVTKRPPFTRSSTRQVLPKPLEWFPILILGKEEIATFLNQNVVENLNKYKEKQSNERNQYEL